MSDLLQDLGASVSALGGNWTKYSVVGSFVLYLFGYLAVRFHLTAIGVGTDLAVLDERYLFAGARFFVYLVSSVPSILLILLPIFAVLWGLARLSPAAARALRTLPARRPAALAWCGVVLAVIMIQFVMRQCFLLSNLLLAAGPSIRPVVAGRPAVRRSMDAPLLCGADVDVRRIGCRSGSRSAMPNRSASLAPVVACWRFWSSCRSSCCQ